MELTEYSIVDWQLAYERGEWTSEQFCEAFLERVKKLDHAGPKLRSVLEVNPDALEIAASLDSERHAYSFLRIAYSLTSSKTSHLHTAWRMVPS